MTARLHRPRHPFRWLGGLLVLAVGLAVAIPYAYIHLISSPAPAALSASAGPAPAAATGGVAGQWRVTTGSAAGYRVSEVLAGQSTTAVGRTSAVTGQFTVDGNQVTAASFSVDLKKVKSDQSLRDAQFQGRIMNTARYPTTTFVLSQPVALDSLATAAGTSTVQAVGTLTLHGVQRSVTVPLKVVRSGTSVQVSGQVPVVFADYKVANPSFGSFVKTQDRGTIEVLLKLAKA